MEVMKDNLHESRVMPTLDGGSFDDAIIFNVSFYLGRGISFSR